MLTTCPECRTTFRINAEQLEVKRGMVRCGYCRAVFNAYDTLLSEQDEPRLTGADADEGLYGGPNLFLDDLEPERDDGAVGSAEDMFDAPIMQDGEEDEPKPAAEIDLFRDAFNEVPRLSAYEEDLDESEETPRPYPDSPLPALDEQETPDSILLSELSTRARADDQGPGFWRGALLGLSSLALLTLLVAQLLYFMRGPIAEWQPDLRPYFEQACAGLGCSVPLARQLDMIKVESSSLETNPEQAAHARLKVSFSNRSRQNQAWPEFVLSLTDMNNETLARRIFRPDEYLPKDKAARDGMNPMSEFEFKFDLDMTGLSASGYEIKPIYL